MLDKLLQVTHIVVHDNCADGTASAMILNLALPKAKVTFCQYETNLHKTLPAEPGMLFCDFSPHLSRVQEFLGVGAIVLDHHGGPAGEVTKICEAAGLGKFGNEPGVSGAVLAYREAFLPLYEAGHLSVSQEQAEYVKEFAETIGIYDTWQRKDPNWEKACHYTESVKFYPWKHLQGTIPSQWRQFIKLGPVLLDKRTESTERAYESAFRFTTSKGTRIATFQGGSKHTSSLADRLGEEIDCLLGFSYLVENGVKKVVMSARSRGTFSCRNLALAFGGGGHVSAAGFAIEFEDDESNPYAMVVSLMMLYEDLEPKWLEIVTQPDFDKKVVVKEINPKKAFEELIVEAVSTKLAYSLLGPADCGHHRHQDSCSVQSSSPVQVEEKDSGL